jgi:hypothetical protein
MAEPDAPIAYLRLPKLHVTYFTFGEISQISELWAQVSVP